MNTIKTGFLMMLMGGILMVVGLILGGITGLIIFLVIALVMNFFSYWFSDKLALRMAGKSRRVEQEEEPELHAIVDEQVARAGIPKPKVYIIDNDSPNAFATGRNPKNASIAATTGIMRLLNREELGGVIAHELAHVGNRDTLIMTMVATVASAIAMVAFMAKISLLFGGFGGRGRGGGGFGGMIGIGGLLLLAIVIPLLTTLVRLGISRTREYQADATGAKTSGTPWALADALEKLEMGSRKVPMEANQATAHLFIVEPMHQQSMSFLNGEGMMRIFSTHPPLAERVRRLRETKTGW